MTGLSIDEAFEGIDFANTTVGDVRDPYPDYVTARREHPVQEIEHFGHRSFGVFRYADVAAVLDDNETFSSSIYAEAMGMVMGPTILQLDGREHLQRRGLIAHAFRRKAMAAWEATTIEPTATALVEQFAGRGRADLVRELAYQLPIRIIASILGIPSQDYGRFARLSIDMISMAVDFDRGMAASRGLGEYLGEIVTRRRAEPRGDLISELATVEIEGQALSDEEVLGFLRLLLPAGAETTFRLLGNLLFGLLSTGQLSEVNEDRGRMAPAIEEALRWESPVQFISRITTHDVTIGGVELPSGSPLTTYLGSANRDEAAYGDPDRYDLHREGPPHQAFGGGHHFCLGAHLARIETTVAVNALLNRVRDLRIDPEAEDVHVRGYAFRSPVSLPVVFDPA